MRRKIRNERPRANRLGNKAARVTPGREDQKRFNRVLGVILISTMILGVICSIWFGWKIRTGLTSLEDDRSAGRKLYEKSLLLEKRRALLVAENVIEKKASVLGLRKPEPKQIVRP